MDIEQTMKFILEMQAKHEGSIQQNNEAISRLERLVETNAHRVSQLVDVSMSLARHGEETDRRLRETDRLINELRDAQARTDYKLNALIDTVDKLVRRNGGAPGVV